MRSHRIKSHMQQGGVLIVLLVILVLAATTAVLTLLEGNSVKLERNKKTYAALAEAKAALIGYAVQQASKPGTLPCTDSNNDGSANTSGINNCTAYIGRLPWKQLGVTMLKDGHAECLWYSLSPVFRNQMTTATRLLNPLNSTTNGTINLVDDNENPITSVNPVIAVIMAPQNPVDGQNRSGVATTYCPGDSLAASYLDLKGAVNNATGNVIGNNYTFKLGSIDNSFNDQIVYVTANELYPLLRKRIAKEILGDVDVPSGLVDYYDTPVGMPHNSYPCPAATVNGLAGTCLLTPVTGFVPYNDPLVDLQYTALGSWLIDNGWFVMTSYQYISPTHIQVTVTDTLGTYTCDANMNVVSCSSP